MACWCPGSQSDLVAAFSSISISTRSRLSGQRLHFSPQQWLRRCSAGIAPLDFPSRLVSRSLLPDSMAATLKAVLIAHPVLPKPVWNADVAGYVEIREERERSDRITLRVERISAERMNERLERVRVSVRKGTAPAVGSFVELKARLSPPLEPLRPGGYELRPGHVLSAHQSIRFRTRPHPHCAVSGVANASFALSRSRRWNTRSDRQTHPRCSARGPRIDCIGADYRQARPDFNAGE